MAAKNVPTHGDRIKTVKIRKLENDVAERSGRKSGRLLWLRLWTSCRLVRDLEGSKGTHYLLEVKAMQGTRPTDPRHLDAL
eukprot:scaffold403397_cov13-Prasinocladus_malaysianus.AAC.1